MKLGTYGYDLLAGAGLCGVFAGLWWIYPPAALIVLGGMACTLGVAGARAAAIARAERRANER